MAHVAAAWNGLLDEVASTSAKTFLARGARGAMAGTLPDRFKLDVLADDGPPARGDTP